MERRLLETGTMYRDAPLETQQASYAARLLTRFPDTAAESAGLLP